jgi:signal transduction histidine kinase
LGLALSKWLVEAMRGKLWAESTLNQGSTFWLELPLVQASTHQTNLIGIRANSSLTDI